MLPLAAYCKAVRATCNTARSLALASNVCMVRAVRLHDRSALHHAQWFGKVMRAQCMCTSDSSFSLA